MQLFLIRHPRPLIDAGVCYGQLDVAAEAPQALAERLRPLLPAGTPVLASPLRRTRALAEDLHPRPLFDRRLMEIDFGQSEGQRWEQIGRQSLDAWAADLLHFVPPGGESAAMLAQIAGYMKNAVAVDWDSINENRPKWNERWNKTIER